MKTPESNNRHIFDPWLQYHERGWSTAPANGKVAAIPWKDFQTRCPTLGEIRLWAEKYQNIVIITGEISGLTVVDCENRQEAEKWNREHPTPLIVETGRGFHLYYQYGEVGNRVKVEGRAFDIRSDGGYVVAPPSIHSTLGTQYRWINEDEYCLDDVPRFDPAWLPEKKTIERLDVCAASDDLVETARRYIMQIHAISGQGGHNSTFRAACRACEFGLTEQQVMSLMLEWNETNARPKFSVKEIQHKMSDAFNR